MKPAPPVTTTRSRPDGEGLAAAAAGGVRCGDRHRRIRAAPASGAGTLGHGAGELDEVPGARLRPGEHVVERVDEVVDLLLAADERRQELDDVDVVGGDLGQDPVAGGTGAHHCTD